MLVWVVLGRDGDCVTLQFDYIYGEIFVEVGWFSKGTFKILDTKGRTTRREGKKLKPYRDQIEHLKTSR